jgi:hypothetical protein
MIDTESMLYRTANVLGVAFTSNGVVVAVRQRLKVEVHTAVLANTLAAVPMILDHLPEKDTPICILYDMTARASTTYAELSKLTTPAPVQVTMRDPSEPANELAPGGRMFYADYGAQLLHTLADLMQRGVIGIDDDRTLAELERLRFKREGQKLSLAEDLPRPFAFACALAAMDVRPRLPKTAKARGGEGYDPFDFMKRKG